MSFKTPKENSEIKHFTFFFFFFWLGIFKFEHLETLQIIRLLANPPK